jgi:hypothetical protein
MSQVLPIPYLVISLTIGPYFGKKATPEIDPDVDCPIFVQSPYLQGVNAIF